MTMPIATQVADAITTIKGRLYAKAGELYFRKSGNGTIYQLTPPGGGGGAVLTPVVRAAGANNVNPGEFAVCKDNAAYTLTLIDGTTDGEQCGFVTTGIDGLDLIILGNIGGNPPGLFSGFQYRAATYVWSATDSLWYMKSVATRDVA